jgi:DNA ligase-1
MKSTTTLYKRQESLNKIQEYTIQVEDDKYRTISGYTDGAKTTSEWTVCSGKNIGRSNETTPSQQAVSEAQAKINKKVDSGYFADIKQIDTSVLFKPMLANKWEDRKDKVTYPLYSQPKLDGIRCIVKEDGMWTRTGKPIDSAPHIFNALAPLFANNPNLIFDGELYADKYSNDFNAIVSLVKKTKPTAKDLADSAKVIEYHIYDLPSSKQAFKQRSDELSKMNLPKCCVKVSTHYVFDEEAVMDLYAEYIEQGYEGQMIRVDGKYENKRSNSLLKHKSFIDQEYTITGVIEGNGNLAGMVGALEFDCPTATTSSFFNASVNGGWEHLQELWKDRASLIGKSATVKYFNLTPAGIPRFPKVIAIRDYE